MYLIVKGVWQLVAHDYPHGAKIQTSRVFQAEEWHLEDAGWEHNLGSDKVY